MQRRRFLGVAATGIVAGGGALVIGLPKAKSRLRRYLTHIEVQPEPGVLTEGQIVTLATFAGALAGDHAPDIAEAMTPWLRHHSENTQGWYDKYSKGASILDGMSLAFAHHTFASLRQHDADRIAREILAQTDSGWDLLTLEARKRWAVRQTITDNLFKGWSLSSRPWMAVGYAEIVPGTFPGSHAYAREPRLSEPFPTQLLARTRA